MASVTPSPTSQSDELHQTLLKLTANSGVVPKKLEQAEQSIRILLLEAQREELRNLESKEWRLDRGRIVVDGLEITKRLSSIDVAIAKVKGRRPQQ